MIQCPNCKAMHPRNTLYCSECGEYLGEDSRATEAFNLGKPKQAGKRCVRNRRRSRVESCRETKRLYFRLTSPLSL